jgi:hypothetical protein
MLPTVRTTEQTQQVNKVKRSLIFPALFQAITLTNLHSDCSSNARRFCDLGVLFVHFGLGQASPEPSGVSLAHSGSRGCSFLENWVSQGALGAPIGHSWASLFVSLCTLWQHMFCIFAFMGVRGGTRRPNGLKVTSLHRVLCAITIVKTDVSTTRRFFCEFVPKSSPKRSQSRLWVAFGAHLASHCRLLGELWASCSTPGGPLWV